MEMRYDAEKDRVEIMEGMTGITIPYRDFYWAYRKLEKERGEYVIRHVSFSDDKYKVFNSDGTPYYPKEAEE